MNVMVSLLMEYINILQQTHFHSFQGATGEKFQEILLKREKRENRQN